MRRVLHLGRFGACGLAGHHVAPGWLLDALRGAGRHLVDHKRSGRFVDMDSKDLGRPAQTARRYAALGWHCRHWVFAFVAFACCGLVAQAGPRSHQTRAEFFKANPCPATGKAGKCPGYVVDHIEPLCAGGADSSTNMQWQTLADSRAKDIEERKQCRAKKASRKVLA